MADQDGSRDSLAAGKGLFDFTFHEDSSDKPPSDIWNLSSTSARPDQSGKKKSWFPNQELFRQDEPSPAVVRTRQGSHALQRRSGVHVADRSAGTTDRIQKHIKTLDDVISRESPRSPHSFTPGVKFRSHLSGVGTPPAFALSTRQFETPKASLTIMDETGMTQEILIDTPAHARDITFMETAPDVSSRTADKRTGLDTTLFEQSRLTDTDTALLEDPAERASRDLTMNFHTCFSSHSNAADILELAQSLENSCEEEMELMKAIEEQTKSSKGTRVPQLLLELNFERCTWQLLHVLYADRIESEALGEDDEDMITDVLTGGGRSHKEIAEEFFKDSMVRQAQLVVDWLEKNAEVNLERYPVKVNYFAETVMWENTLHCLKNNIDTERLITKMDPDAPTREGKHLAELDEKDEQSLVRHLFTCVRAGQLAKAQELCVQCGQSWRAATLEGWKLHHDPNRGKKLDETLENVEGNLSRDLWKITCWGLAKDPYFSVHEKAIYAALSGNIKQILPACNSWLDYVWAYFKVMVDVLTEKRLRSCSPATGQVLETMPDDYWNAILIPEVIMQEIEASPSLTIQRECKNHFHVAQKHIILGDLDGLVVTMHGWLKDHPKVYMLRFMAHLVLFIRALDATVEEDCCDDILEAYIKELIQLKFNHVVALYTSRLSSTPRQVSCYASLLQDIEDADEQKRCLDLGKEAGLDMDLITKTVVEHIRSIGVDETSVPPPPIVGNFLEGEITKLDNVKIEVIKWLVFEESQRAEAIRQGNALMRFFMAAGKYTAARAVLGQIPTDSVEVVMKNWRMQFGDEPLSQAMTDDIQEYHSFLAYFEANDAFNSWFDYFHHKKPESPPQPTREDFKGSVAYDHNIAKYKVEESQWEAHLKHLTEDVEEKLNNVLLFPGGWMVPAYGTPFNSEEERRATQMKHLRQMCVPQLCFLLHTALHETGLYRKCLQLADVIASEEFQLYKVFHQQELEKLLSLLHNSACAALNEPHTELGYPH